MTMRPENEREVYELADEALAHARVADDKSPHMTEVLKNLELIRRLTDPARRE